MIIFQGEMYRSYTSLIIVVILLIENCIVIFMQSKDLNLLDTVLLWIIETVGICFILWITGGVTSPYFWLIINPMLLGVFTTKRINYYQHLAIVLIILLLFREANGSFYKITNIQQMHFVLGLVIISIYSLLITTTYNVQNSINRSLIRDKSHIQRTLEVNEKLNTNIMDSLELLEKIEFTSDYEILVELFCIYIKETLKTEKYFIVNESAIISYSEKLRYSEYAYIVENCIKSNLFYEKDIQYFDLPTKEKIIVAKAQYRQHGLYFGYKLGTNDEKLMELSAKQLEHIVRLYKLAIAKVNSDQLKKEISIKDEQNRIAEEMHDNVNQDLFALGCQLFNIRTEVEKDAEKEELLQKINKTYVLVDRTTKDLKKIINNMSIKKTAGALIIKDIENYLEEMGEIFNIKIESNISPEITYCDLNVQDMIFRILNETISNAVRHGKAKAVRIRIYIENDVIFMTVVDNGIGIQKDSLNEKTRGLGIYNLEKIAKSRGGKFSLESNENGTGVVLNISFGVA